MSELKLNVGARVYCRDGKYGRLLALVVDGESGCTTHIIVEQGFLQRSYRLLPISIVEQATTGDVYLALSNAAVASYAAYQPEQAAA